MDKNKPTLALANSGQLAKKISEEKKGREWYRPLAPVALEENVRYFTGKTKFHPLSKYMLLDFKVLPEKQKEISGVVHTDGTARFQTLFNRDDNPFLYDLLRHLNNEYNIKALINTSFNRKGEPIVHTEEDTLKAAVEIKPDALVLNGILKTFL